MGTWIVIAIVVLVVLWLVFTYNGLISARNRTQEAWSEIDVELKRRHDLIPNLVNTAQGYMGHERGTLEAVTNLQETLTATEDKIEFSRRFYNGNVRDYNIKLQTLPTSLIAGALGFKAFGFFQADEGDRAVPQVSFGNTPVAGAPPGPGSLPPAAGSGPPPMGSSGPPPQS